MKVVYWSAQIAIFAILASLLGSCGGESVTPPPSGPYQTATSIPLPLLVDIGELVPSRPPSYWGITPGVSYKQDVLEQWGEPNVVRRYEKYESLHYFTRTQNDSTIVEEYFLIKDGTVEAVTFTAYRVRLAVDGQLASLDDLKGILGAPDIITPAIGLSLPTWVFADYGLAVSRIMGDRIYMYQFFVPMDFRRYRALWGKYPLGVDPFPLIPGIETVGINPGQTVRKQVEESLGPPDRVIYEDPNDPWLYYIEPDTEGRLFIYFDSDGVVTDMFVNNIQIEMSLGEIVQKYGPPDAVQFIPGMEGQQYYRQSLLYLNRGLVITAVCPTSACSLLQNTPISQKWYLQPTTLEEYRKDFPGSAFMEWHGFND